MNSALKLYTNCMCGITLKGDLLWKFLYNACPKGIAF
jgi:hypothetical protein